MWAIPELLQVADAATAQFPADKFSALSMTCDAFRLNFLINEVVLDMAHREVDLGLRNRSAESGNLAWRRLGRLCLAPCRRWSVLRPELLE